MSLRRLMVRDCCGVTASSLASIKRLSALEELALDRLTSAGGNDALQLLARQLPVGLTHFGFSCKTGAIWEVSACGWRQQSLSVLICLQCMPCTCLSSQQMGECGGLPPLQPQQEDDPGRLTDAGTQAFACALEAAEPADRPTLEYLALDGQLAIGAATAAALATAPFRRVSQLSLNYGGALQRDHAGAPLSAERSLCDRLQCETMLSCQGCTDLVAS